MRSEHLLHFYGDKKYWNVDERDFFMHNTTTLWRGLRHKNLDRGIFINNDTQITAEDQRMVNSVEGELKLAIEKYGPLQYHDYDYNYKYQTEKRILEHKRELYNQHKLLH